jgi:3-deoxy-manno-octulosonate cytidylyltransferase (CMP-KDO synthetase)
MRNPVVVIIPARYGSTRFPAKPLATIEGISILERTYKQVMLCPRVHRCIIATDDARIESHARSFCSEVVMTSSSASTGTDRIAEVVQKDTSLQSAFAIINVQGDEPCIPPSTIEAVIQVLCDSPDIQLATAIAPIKSRNELENRNIVKCVRSLENRALYFSRHPIPYEKEPTGRTHFRHVGIYGFRPDFLLRFANLPTTPLQKAEDLEMLRAMEHGYQIAVAEVPVHSPDVNVPKDLEEVQQWIRNQHFCS